MIIILNKNVLFITTVYPYPKDDGKKIILSSILEYFQTIFGENQVNIALIGNHDVDVSKSPFKIMHLPKPQKHIQIKNVLTTMVNKKSSIQESVLYSKSIQEKIDEIIDKGNYDYVILDTIRTAQYRIEVPESKKYVYMDDLFSVRYEKMLEVLSNHPSVDLNPLGNFKKYIPKPFIKLVKLKLLTKNLLRIEKDLVSKSELAISKKYKNCLLISEQEVQYMKNVKGISGINSIKPILRSNSYNREISFQNKDFIFLGNLSIAHNDVSIVTFIEKNINQLISHKLNIKIIGKQPSGRLLDLAEAYPNNVKLIGFVEDLESEFSTALGMIVPLLFGTGVKIKTLEAFSYGLPIITTDYGVEGINIDLDQSNPNCLIENNIDNYWKRMLELCDVEFNKRVSINSYNFFQTNYSKETIYSEYNKIFGIQGNQTETLEKREEYI